MPQHRSARAHIAGRPDAADRRARRARRGRARLGRGAAVLTAMALVSCTSGAPIQQAGESTADTDADTDADASSSSTAESDAGSGSASGTAEDGAEDSSGAGESEAAENGSTDGGIRCDVEAFAAGDGQVEIDFLYGLAPDISQIIDPLIEAYHASQDRVRVTTNNLGDYGSVLTNYLPSDQDSRPELVMFPEYSLRELAVSESVVPVQACIDADTSFDAGVFLDRAIDAYALGDTQWAMPFNMSTPVLIYNRAAFEAAGLDPDVAPTSLAELRTMSEQLVGSGVVSTGLALDISADGGGGWVLEQWLARAGEPYADNGNGRDAPATEVAFDGPAAVELMTELQQMVADGLVERTSPGPQAALLKMVDQTSPAAMTVATSAAIGAALQALSTGIFPLGPEAMGVAPLPGPQVQPGAQVGGGSLWIVDKDPEVSAAVWDFITYLTSAEVQAEFAGLSGYVPVRPDAADVEPLTTTYATDPRFAVAFDQFAAAAEGSISAAPALGPHRQIRNITADAVFDIFEGADVQTTLSAAAGEADLALASWNDLHGG